VNTSTEIWKDADTDYLVAFQQENEFMDSTSNKVYWYEVDATPVNQGEIILNKASNFPEDSTSVISATLIQNELWVAYRYGTTAAVANCKLTATAGIIEIKDVADCTTYPLPQQIAAVTSIRVYSEDTKFFAYILTRTASTLTLGSCNLDATTKSMIDCLYSNKSIDISGEKLLRFDFDNTNGARILFTDSDAQSIIKVASTIVFGVEFQVDEKVVNFDYLQDKNSKFLVGSPNSVFSFRATTFSTFKSVSD
jgi:hypothetical protein